MNRKSFIAGALVALLAGCNSPHLVVSPDKVQIATGEAVVLQGYGQDSSGTVLWSLNGPGTLTPVSGPLVYYYAPASWDPSAPKTATSTATLSDAPVEVRMI